MLHETVFKKQFRQDSKVRSISSSEGDGNFQELSSRSNQIHTVTDMASLKGRSYEICIISGSISLGPVFGP